MSYLEIINLSKNYGTQAVINNANIVIEKGEAVAFIGPNGAGKTTLLRMIAGITAPSSGEIRVRGVKIDKSGITRGLLLENAPFVEYFSGRENLKMLARLSRSCARYDISEIIRYVGLDPDDRRPVSKYSQGMRQRLGLAQALMDEPELLLLDEPTNGLDPQAIIEFRTLIRRQLDCESTVIILTHILSEVTKLCDRAFVVHSGEVSELVKPNSVKSDLEEEYLRAVRCLTHRVSDQNVGSQNDC